MTHRFRLSLAALTLTLAAFAMVPSEAKAAQVMCSNEYGSCEVQNSPSFITCSCVDESSTGGTGGNDFEGMTEEELMAVCEAELSWCQPQDTSTTDETTTFGGTGDTEGTGTSTGDTEGTTSTTGDTEGTSTGDTGTSSTGDTDGSTTSTSGDTASTGGDSSGDAGTGDAGTEGDAGTAGDTNAGTEGDAGGSEGGSEGTGGADEAEGDAGIEEGKGCSMANEPGYGVFALFGMLGLLGFRSRRTT